LPGDIRLSVFPWLALELGPASLGNPPGFGAEPFATLQRVKARIRVLPLLRGELEAGRLEIDGLDLRLAQDAAGKGNWEDFGQAAEDADAGTTDASPGTPRLQLAGIVVRDSRIAFEDLSVEQLGVDIGSVVPGRPVTVSLRANVIPTPGDAPIPLTLATTLTPDVDAQRYRFAPLALAGSLPPSADSAQGTAALPWRFDAPTLDLDLAQQTLAAPAFEAGYGAARLGGSIDGTKIIDAPELTGRFALQPVSPRDLLRESGTAPPVTRDAKVLSRLEAGGQFRYAGDLLSATDLVVQLDESKLTGSAGTELETGAVTFDLALDRIDLDRYLPPPTAADATAKAEPFELPVDALKPLNAKGTFSIGEAKVSGMKLAQVRVGLDARDGVTRLSPARAQLYGGQYSGHITVDARPATPRLTLDQAMTGIDVATLMRDLLDTKRLAGRGNVTTKLTADGRNSDQLVRTLSGQVTADLVNGAVEGLDVWHAIAQAQSLLQKRQLAGTPDTKRTAFETFHASADVAGGVATTRDLVIASQLLRITGGGNASLASQAIDYQLTAAVLREPPGDDAGLTALARASIPVRITGTFDDPKIRPDLGGIAKAKLKQEVEKQKDKLEEKVKDRLKGLFNR
jgi:AsmA protein